VAAGRASASEGAAEQSCETLSQRVDPEDRSWCKRGDRTHKEFSTTLDYIVFFFCRSHRPL
jgi:hypothetical protein